MFEFLMGARVCEVLVVVGGVLIIIALFFVNVGDSVVIARRRRLMLAVGLGLLAVGIIWCFINRPKEPGKIALYACEDVVTSSADLCGTGNSIGFAKDEVGSPLMYEVVEGSFSYYGTADPGKQGPVQRIGSLGGSLRTRAVYQIAGADGVCHDWAGVLVLVRTKEIEGEECEGAEFGYLYEN